MNSCFENIAPGNTVLLNNPAIKVINSLQNPPVVHYDSWIYLLISTFGKVDLIPSYFVRYRIHLNNSVGLRKNSFATTRKSIKNYLEQQTFLLDEKLEYLSQNQRKHLIAISTLVKEKSLRKKLLLFSKLKIGRQSILDNLFFKFFMLFVR